MRKYMKADLYRVFTSPGFYMSIMGVMLICRICGSETSGNTFAQYTYVSWQSAYTMIYAAGALAFSNCFVEDGEHKFWYFAILRGKNRQYIWSKVWICFISTVLAVTIGMFLFYGFQEIINPFEYEEDYVKMFIPHDSFGFLLKKRYYYIYYFAASAMRGLLAGVLALMALYLSLFVKNRLFTIAVPVVGYYFILNYLPDSTSGLLNLSIIFEPQNDLFVHKAVGIIYAVGVSLCLCLGMGILIQKRVEREIEQR